MISAALQASEKTGRMVLFWGKSLKVMFTQRWFWQETVIQLNRTIAGSLFVVVLISAFVGANVVVQGYQMLKVFGAEDLTGMFVGLAVIRELGPMLAGAMVGAKAGCEMASELAAMRIQQQIDALEVMAVNPIQYLVVPRIVAMAVGLPLMLGFAICAAILASYLVASYQFDLNTTTFMARLAETNTIFDLKIALMKTVFFGLFIALIECYEGFHAKPGPTGVGEATNMTIVLGALAVAWINMVMTAMVY